MSKPLSRDDFVAMMISELKLQEESGDLFREQSKSTSSADVLHKLSFDFPDVTGEELRILADDIPRMLGSEAAVAGEEGQFVLKPKLLENIFFLHGHASDGGSGGAAGGGGVSSTCSSKYTTTDVASLAAAVFLQVPRYVLTSSVSKVCSLFGSADGTPCETVTECLTRMVSFLGVMESSLLAAVPEKPCRGHMDAVLEALRLLLPSVDDNGAGECFQPSSASPSSPFRDVLLVASLSQESSSAGVRSIGSDNERGDGGHDHSRVSLRQELLVKLVLLSRDILASMPALAPQILPRLVLAVLPSSSSSSANREADVSAGAGIGFPSIRECLICLMFAGVYGAVADAHALALGFRRGAPETQKGGGGATCSRDTLIGLRSTLLDELPRLTSCAARMKQQGAPVVESEGIVLLINMSMFLICADVGAGATQKRETHEALLNSRLLHEVVDTVSHWGTALASYAGPLVEVVSLWAVHSADCAAFVLRMPVVVALLHEIAVAGMSIGRSDHALASVQSVEYTQQRQAPTTAVAALVRRGSLVPLLVALACAENATGVSRTRVAEQVLTTSLSCSLDAVQEALITNSDGDDDGDDHEDKNRTTGAPRSRFPWELVQSLHMLASYLARAPGGGTVRSLASGPKAELLRWTRSLEAMTDADQTCAADMAARVTPMCETSIATQSLACAALRRASKAVRTLLEGGSSKAD